MIIGTVLPSYQNLFSKTNSVNRPKNEKTRSEKEQERLKPKTSDTSVQNENSGRVLDVSI